MISCSTMTRSMIWNTHMVTWTLVDPMTQRRLF
jgi:hypothetical protein